MLGVRPKTEIVAVALVYYGTTITDADQTVRIFDGYGCLRWRRKIVGADLKDNFVDGSLGAGGMLCSVGCGFGSTLLAMLCYATDWKGKDGRVRRVRPREKRTFGGLCSASFFFFKLCECRG